MTDISYIFGGAYTLSSAPVTAPPEEQIRDAMFSVGIEPPDNIIMDGRLHRFRSGTKGKGGHDKAGWYVIYGDGVPAGRFGCWRAGIEQTWRADLGRDLSPAEEMANARRIADAMRLRDDELRKTREAVSNTVESIWSGGSIASDTHPYLQAKGISAHGARVTGDGRLMVPLYLPDGTLSSMQYIDNNGGKKYHNGGQTAGAFWSIGEPSEVIYIAEGFATAATIHQVTGAQVFISYSASNIVKIVEPIKQSIDAEIVIIADNDESGTGIKYAEQAAAIIGARVVMPPMLGDANDYVMSGHDLLALITPVVDSDWLIPADEFCAQPSPIKWLIKGWLQDEALIMVHGQSGGGKTFVVLDWCLHLASGKDNWNGHKLHGGPVVYLAGEGHHGLRGRVAAWKQENKPESLNMWLSRAGCDLNKPTGYQMVLTQVRALPERPRLIVVDTLHRFLDGDENSAQDAKTMLDACNALMAEFGCSVLLVHHTGVSDEAQHRARGSSAWRGALDIEISIVPGKNGGPLKIIQRKSKDAEITGDLQAELVSTPISGWLDDDGDPVTSAIVTNVTAASEVEPKADSKLEKARKLFQNAYIASGMDKSPAGEPYLSRSALIDYLINTQGMSESSAKQYAKPTGGKLITELLSAELISASGNGWIIPNGEWSSALMIMDSSSSGNGNFR